MQSFNFPDGMPHIKLDVSLVEFLKHDLNYSIRNPTDLFKFALINDIAYPCTNLHYVMGSRMDRKISENEPNTLKVVCDILNNVNAGSTYIVIFPHSQSIIDRLNAEQDLQYEINFLKRGIDKCLTEFHSYDCDIILPDAGAEKRFYNDHLSLMNNYPECNIVACTKHRNMSTGKLSGFSVPSTVKETVVILDDLIDGGRTFSGLSKELRNKGAKKVGLVAYHSIFSGGTNLEYVDYIYTSNSFKYTEAPNVFCEQIPCLI